MAISKSVLWKKNWSEYYIMLNSLFPLQISIILSIVRGIELGAYGGGHLMLGISLIGFVVVEICMVIFFWGGGGNLYFIISFFMSTAEVCIVLYRNMKIYFIHWRLSSSPKKISFMQRKAIVLVIFCPVLN